MPMHAMACAIWLFAVVPVVAGCGASLPDCTSASIRTECVDMLDFFICQEVLGRPMGAYGRFLSTLVKFAIMPDTHDTR